MKILILSLCLAVGSVETGLKDLIENYPDPTTEFCIYSGVITPEAQATLEKAGAVVKNRFENDAESSGFFIHPIKREVSHSNAYLNIKKIVANEQPDIIKVLTHFDVIPAAMVSLETGIPMLSIFHHSPIDFCNNLSPLDRPLFKKTREFGEYYSASRYAANYLSEHLLDIPLSRNINENEVSGSINEDEGRVASIFNGVDLNRFKKSDEDRNKIRSQFNIPDDAVVVGDVGRINLFLKRQQWIVSAVTHLHQIGIKNVYGLIVGDGEQLKRLKEFAQYSGVEDFIVFVGEQKNPVPFYNAMDIFAHASNQESFGRALMEALGCGLPLVMCTPYEPLGVDADGYGFVKNHYNGLIVHSDNKKGFIKTIELLVRNKNIRDALSAVARKSVETFDVPTMVQNYYEIFTEAAKQPRIPQPKKLQEFMDLVAIASFKKALTVNFVHEK